MKRFFLLIVVLSVSFLHANSQKSTVIPIPWSSYECISFQGRSYNFPKLLDGQVDLVNGLPLYQHSIPLENGVDVLDLSVKGLDASYLLSSNQADCRVVNLIDVFKVEWTVVYDQGVRYLTFTCNPAFRSNDGDLLFYRSLSVNVHTAKVNANKLKSSQSIFKTSSVLSTGKWVKVSIEKSGVYQLDYATLNTWGFSNPQKVHVFGNGGTTLSKINSDLITDDLAEVPLVDTGKSLLFYGTGVVSWDYNQSYSMYIHKMNIYDRYSYYYITESDLPKKELFEAPLSTSYDTVSTTYTGLEFHELNLTNLLKSGKVWLGEEFSNSQNKLYHTFQFNTSNINTSSSNNIKIYTELVARSDKSSSFNFFVNKAVDASGSILCSGVTLGSITDRYVDERSLKFDANSTMPVTELMIQYVPNSTSSLGWINFISVNARKNLVLNDSWLTFRNPEITQEGILTKFVITGTQGKNMVVWDVSSPLSPLNIGVNQSGNDLSFIVAKGRFQEFLAFDTGGEFQTPNYVESVSNQNLHGLGQTEYVIVAPNQFLNEANKLAQIHRMHNNIDPVVVSSESVYNEFSSGKQDPVAIRTFLRMFYSRSDVSKNDAPKYLLLYGDGSYDNLGVNSANKSKIVTYQSDKSFHQTESYVTDDFFGCLDDSEGSYEGVDKLDIGIGRFVVNSEEEAKAANSKVLAYLTGQDKNDWQSRITFVAQDGDDNLHQRDAEDLSNYIRAVNPEFNLNKIYCDSYPKAVNAQTGSYPEAEKAVNNALNVDGTLIFNYTGHGAVEAIAYKLLTIGKADNLSNLSRLPLFVTATCEISRFDNPEEKSLGEHIFLNPNGGGIGLLSTTRVVYSFFNKNINLNFYQNAFLKDGDNLPSRIGDIMRRTKNGALSGVNKLNFTLLCDPALRLNYPIGKATVGQVFDVRVDQVIDTIHGLTHGVLSGEVKDQSGNLRSTFNGNATIALYDKASKISTLGNSGQRPFVYEDYQSVLYKGTVDIKNGLFSSEFVIPSDIRYDYGKGRITLFCSSDSETAFGHNGGYTIGGLEESAEFDDVGPDLSLFLNSTAFKDGSKCGPTPLFIGRVFDQMGINTAGAGIGHDLFLTVDDDPYNSFVLNNNFVFDKDSYQSGEVKFQLSKLSPGVHKLTFRIWDCNNNSTTKSISFEVVEDDELQMDNIMLYPNPVSQEGPLNLSFTHDEPNGNFDITMEVYGMDGRLIDRNDYQRADKNGLIEAIEWSPAKISGGMLDPGVYLCKLLISSSTGQISNFSKRFVVIQ